MTVQDYFRQLAAVCREAAKTDDPRVIMFAGELLELAGARFAAAGILVREEEARQREGLRLVTT